MGRSLGYFDSDELDRPELNKCPECECYFASDECPLCGKVCPEHMRAGNRAAVKKPKKTRNSSGRVQFIPWFFSWWFITMMMFFMPVVGIVLLVTSPHAKKWKILFAVLAAVYFVVVHLGGGSYLLNRFFEKNPVNDDISREAYVEKCEELNFDEFFRTYYEHEGEYVTMELTVTERLEDLYDSGKYYVYYICRVEGSDHYILLRDCQLENKLTFMGGDMIRVWGENAGEQIVETYDDFYRSICLNVAYAQLIG